MMYTCRDRQIVTGIGRDSQVEWRDSIGFGGMQHANRHCQNTYGPQSRQVHSLPGKKY